MLFKSSILLFCTLLVASCASTKIGKNDLTGEVPAIYSTQVFVGNCAFFDDDTTGALALADSLISSVISNGVNLLGNALTAAASKKISNVEASSPFEMSAFYFPNCVQVVRGKFATRRITSEDMSWAVGDDHYGEIASELEILGILLTDKPDFFFEGVFRRSSLADNVKTLVPSFVSFENPVEDVTFAGSARRIELSFSIHDPGVARTASGNPSANLSLGEFKAGDTVLFERDPTVYGGGKPTTGSNFVPSLFRYPFESNWFEVPAPTKLTPSTISVLVTETKDEEEHLAFLASVFGDTKEELKAELEARLIDEKLQQEKLESLKAKAALKTASTNAFSAAVVALNACMNSGAVATAATAQSKQLEANNAAFAAGQTQPFAPQVIVEVSTSASVNKAKCKSAFDSVS